ncbi:MAG: dihydrolipoyl dehydrogenase [Cyanobacteria bacterium]|nr:dihydrolipoyl dehydrogenase [Cyanobacteriota bacterium]
MPAQETRVDTVVIGSGPGGYVAAIRLAQLGQSVAIVEKEALGGVCLNWGCIPSKALIYVASLYEKIQHVDMMGITVGSVSLDMPKLQAWKADVVKKLTGGIGSLLKSHGVQVIMGEARFSGSHTLSIASNTNASEITLAFKHAIIATGSSPVQIPGFELNGKTIVDSREALEFTEVPSSLAIMGGGVIGLEMACLYAKLGSQVTVIEMMPQLLPGTDADIVQMLERSLKKRGIQVFTQSKVLSAKIASDKQAGVTLEIETPKEKKTVSVDKLLVSVGRRPNSAGLSLDKAGVQTNDKGFITVNQQLKTSSPHIFAIGDVTSAPLLAHKASKEGLVAAAVIAGSSEILDYRAMPGAVFTDPEVATVGLTEAQAKEQGYDIRVGKFPFQASGRALSMNETEGFVKVIADAKTDVLLGVHMMGPDVSELIAEATLAIEMGATAEDISLTVHAHPTLPESFMEAAEAVHQKAIHIYQAKTPSKVPVASTK